MKMYAFMGKGGVGKTTLACEWARYCARCGKTIIISLDHQNNHIDYVKAKGYDIETFKLEDNASELMQDIISGTMLKGYTIYAPSFAPDYVSIANVSEAVYMIQDQYDFIILDFPPNHSGLTLISLPNILENMTFKAMTMKNRIRRMVTGHDQVLDSADYLYKITANFKLQAQNCHWFVVGIPAAISYSECEKAIDYLQNLNYNVAKLIVNMVEEPHYQCPTCDLRFTRSLEQVNRFETLTEEKGLTMIKIPYSYDTDVIYRMLKLGLMEPDRALTINQEVKNNDNDLAIS